MSCDECVTDLSPEHPRQGGGVAIAYDGGYYPPLLEEKSGPLSFSRLLTPATTLRLR